MSSWVSRVRRIAEQIEIDPNSVNFKSDKIESKDISNDFRGSAFEGFCEIFLKIYGCVLQIGIRNYEPCSSDIDIPDMGVDSTGIRIGQGISKELLVGKIEEIE